MKIADKRLVTVAGALLIVILALNSCSKVSQGDSRSPRQIVDRTPDANSVTMVLVYYDMEGLSGQNIITSIDYPRPEYFEARELLTNDVNAVIAGLFAGGADSVYVVDAHGSFNPEPDILLDKMDARAKMLYRDKRFDSYVDLIDSNVFDAVVMVAAHSRTGGGGFAEHTVNLGTDWILNGMSINEAELLAYSWGRIGVPLILVSGDDKVAEQLSWMNWLERVVTKEARGIDDALLYPVDSVHAELRAAATRSIANLDGAKAAKLTEPVTATLKVRPPADLSLLAGMPGVDYKDEAVSFTAPNFEEAYSGMRGLLAVAQAGYINIAAELYLGSGPDAFMNFKEAVFESWIKSTVDTGKSAEPAESAPAAKTGSYFGSK